MAKRMGVCCSWLVVLQLGTEWALHSSALGGGLGGAVVRSVARSAEPVEVDKATARLERRADSLTRFKQVPDWRSKASKAKRAEWAQSQTTDDLFFEGKPLGGYAVARNAALENAAAEGDAGWLQALLDAGVDVDTTNSFGQSPLFIASWFGHTDVVALLLHYGANPAIPAAGGCTAWRAAASRGYHSVLQMLEDAGTHPEAIANSEVHREDAMSAKAGHLLAEPPAVKAVIKEGSAHPGRGSWVIDGAFEEVLLARLDDIGAGLPTPDVHMDRRTARRLFYCDAEGVIVTSVRAALIAAGFAAAVVSPWMRFLVYRASGRWLKPHVDYQWIPGFHSNEMPGYAHKVGETTHSFLLYLADCEQGGDTLLLESLVYDLENGDDSEGRVAVRPRRGRLLLFPHDCPHAGAPLESLPKVILRGDVRLGPRD